MKRMNTLGIVPLFFLAGAAYGSEVAPKIASQTQSLSEPMRYHINGYPIPVFLGRQAGKYKIRITFSDRTSGRDYGNFTVQYDGACEKQIEFSARYMWSHDNKNDFSKYEETGDIHDLPVSDMITAMQEVLTDQCSNVESIRFYLAGQHSSIRNTPYEGTMRRRNNWVIEKGTTLEDSNEYTFDTKGKIGEALYYRGELIEQPVEIIFWAERDVPSHLALEGFQRTAVAYFPENDCFMEGIVSPSEGSLRFEPMWERMPYFHGVNRCSSTIIRVEVRTKGSDSNLELKPYYVSVAGQHMRRRITELKQEQHSSETIYTLYQAQIHAVNQHKERLAAKSQERKRITDLFKGDQSARFNQYGIYQPDDLVLFHPEHEDPNYSPAMRLQSWLAYGMFDQFLNNDVLFARYFVDFMGYYAQQCRAHLIDPIMYSTRLDQVTTDGWGHELVREEGEIKQILLARAYLEHFKRANARVGSQAMSELFSIMLSGRQRAIPSWVEKHKDQNDSTIADFLKNGCMSDPVQAVYKNLLNKSAGAPPVKLTL